ADRRPPRRRHISLARRRGAVAPLPARNVIGGADAGGRAMNEVAGRIRGAVHAAVGHDSGVAHVTGAARYLDAIRVVPGTLEAALLLSPHAHARIRHVDLSAALAAPGVVAAITAADIPGKNDIAPIRSDEPALAAGVVEYEGQPVAAVAAATLDEARTAAKLIDIEYEPLPAVLSIEEAMARESFVAPPQTMVHGEVEPALAAAPCRRTALRRPGPFLPRGPDRARDPGRGRGPARVELDPASDGGAARRRASARASVQRRHRRGAAHGWRVRRQGEPGDHHRR